MAEQKTSEEQKQPGTLSAAGFDRGWVFCFSVLSKDVQTAEALLNKIYAKAHVTIQKLPVGEMRRPFRPDDSRGTAFMVRQTPQTDADIGMLAGLVEDAFRDNGVRPGPMPTHMATIDGVSYTTYRNETDPEGELLTSDDWAQLERARPPHQLYNPFLKADPWADLVYEYAPAAADLEPAPSARKSTLDMVEDFDVDLGTLLSEVFSGVDDTHLTQPESSRGWIFDKSYGHEPYYAFYACPITIKPVRQTLRRAGIPFHHTEHGDWHGVIISKDHFTTAQDILQQPEQVPALKSYYNKAARGLLHPTGEGGDTRPVSEL